MITSGRLTERILLIGGWGVGKSHAIKDIAENISGTVFVVDVNHEAERNFDGIENVKILPVFGMMDYIKAAKKANVMMKAGDWLAVDRMDPLWDAAQDNFIEEVFGKEADEWFMDMRKDVSGHPLAGEYGMNWAVIKKRYAAFMDELYKFNQQGHLLLTASAQEIRTPDREGKGGDPEQVRAEFGKYGVRPGGKKDLGFFPHTTLLLAEPKEGQWIFTTIRDRNRRVARSETLQSFSTSYLVNMAGWTNTVPSE